MDQGGPIFSAELEPAGDSVRLVLCGELDLASVDRAQDAFDRAEGQQGHVRLLDLSALSFIDSAGLRFVLEADSRSRRDGSRLRLVPGPPAVQRVFELTRTQERLPFLAA